MKTLRKTLMIKVSASTARWLTALAEANNVTPGQLLEQAAFCMSDYAGRRTGSWESAVARELLVSCGYQKDISYDRYERLLVREEADNAAFRAALKERNDR